MGWPIKEPSTIYAIRCKANGKIYVGATYRLEQRIKEHFSELKKEQKRTYKYPGYVEADIQRDYNKWGEAGFEVYVIEEGVSPASRKEREAFWIEEFKTSNPSFGYNKRDERIKGLPAEIKRGVPPKPKGVKNAANET